MKTGLRYISIAILIFALPRCGNEKEAIVLSGKDYVVDSVNRLILYNGANLDDHSSKIWLGTDDFRIVNPEKNLGGNAFRMGYWHGNAYALYCTDLPIVQITTKGQEIPDDPKVFAEFLLLEPKHKPIRAVVAIERRGGVSRSFPKKSYRLELRHGTTDSSLSMPLLGMRNDDDWLLDGMWNEPLRLRDHVSHELWNLMATASNAKTHLPSVDRRYCDFFLNGEYKGIYYLGERLDLHGINITQFQLHKATSWAKGTIFEAEKVPQDSQRNWSGFRDYSEERTDWHDLHDFITFVESSSESEFESDIFNWLDLHNSVDYFIFLNLTFALDNIFKNMYIGRPDSDSPYAMTPWDLDGTFGNNWDGARVEQTDNLLANPLFDRLLENDKFRSTMKARWKILKTTILHPDSIIKLFENNHALLLKSGSYAREAAVEELPGPYRKDEMQFLKSWIVARTNFLDQWIERKFNNFH